MIRDERGDKVCIEPWPPRISTHPPSRFLCILWPMYNGVRAVVCLLIGVANAILVIKKLNFLKLMRSEDFVFGFTIKHPSNVPVRAIRSA